MKSMFTRCFSRPWKIVLALILAISLLSAAVAWAAPLLTASKTVTLLVDNDSDGRADPGDTLRYTVAIQNSGPDPATGVTFTDTIDANTTLVGGSLTASPVADNDTYPQTVIGNVSINSAWIPYSVVTNDFLGLNPAATIVAYDMTTSQGGQVVMTTSGAGMGQFTYNPPPGFEGADSFTYTLADNPNAGSAAANRTATVNITVSGMVWFIDNNAPACTSAGCGRLSNPFSTLAAFNGLNDGAGNHPADNDNIFIYESATAYSGGVTLRNGQKLIGQDATVSLATITGLTPPSGSAAFPAMNTGGSAATIQNAVTNGVSATDDVPAVIRGLSLSGLANAIDITINDGSAGTLEIKDNTIVSAGAEGIDINKAGAGTLTLDVQNNAWNAGGAHTGNAFDARTSAGSVNLNFSNNTNVLSSATGIFLERTGGAFTVTGFAANSVSGNSAGTGISANSVTFDTSPGGAFQTVSGGVTAIGALGNGVGASGMILTNVSGDLSFTDLDIFADNGEGLNASGTTAYTGSAGFQLAVTGGTATIAATNGPAVNLTIVTAALLFQDIDSANSSTTGVSLTSVLGAFSAGSGSAITNASGADFFISSGTANVTYDGTITDDVGTLVSVASATGGAKSFTGAINDGNDGDGSGISLTNNSSSTITFSGGLLLSTGSNAAFTATGGGTVNVCDENPCNPAATGALVNTLTTTSGTALNVVNTTIGANDLEFRSISANGAANGIVLNNTGASGNLAVKGDSGSSNNSSGGTIQNTTGHGISLTSTQDVLLDQMNIQSTGASGVNGVDVTNFTFTNGTINNSGNALGESNIAFNGNGALTGNNFDGVLTITGSTLTNAYDHGIHVENDNGTISNALIQNNTITSSTSTATSKGSGIQLIGTGNVSTASNLTRATISSNTVRNFPSGAGIQVNYGNSNSSGPGATAGVAGSGTDIINIVNNVARGFDAANRFGTHAIIFSVSGGNSASRSQGNFNVSNNGTVGDPIGNSLGIALGVGNNGFSTMTAIINNNVIVANNTMASGGISGGNGVVIGCPTRCETPLLTLTVTNNNISQTDGNGILLVGRGTTGIANFGVRNNTVAAPLSGVRPGIRVDAGNSSAGSDDAVCLDISGNTTGGSGGHEGIGLRKQGSVSTTHDFGIEGMAATSSPGVETYVGNTGQNPGTANGSFGINGVLLLSSTSGFSNCSTSAMPMPEISDQSAVTGEETVENPTARSERPSGDWGVEESNVEPVSDNRQSAAVTNPEPSTFTIQPSTALGQPSTAKPIGILSGETAAVGPFTLPAGKSITIIFDVTVDDPFGGAAAQVCNQGAVSSNELLDVLTDDPGVGGATDPTCTAVNLTTDLAITKTDGAASAIPGTSVTYTIVASNIGPYAAAGATVADTFPAALSSVTWTCVGAGGGTCAASGSGNINEMVNIPAGGSVIFTAFGAIDPGATGSLANTASVAVPLAMDDSDLGNNSATDTDTLTPQADLSLAKSDGGASVAPGGTVIYNLLVSNTGPSHAAGVILTETVPANSTFNAGASSAGWVCVPDNNPGSVCTLSVGALNAGSSVSRSFAVTVVSPAPAGLDQISNSASVSSSVTDPNPGNDSASDTTPVNAAPELSLTKSDGGASVAPSGTAAYTLNYANNGNQGASGVVLLDTVPANTTFDPGSSTPGWACAPDNSAGSLCTLSIGALNSGASGSATFAVNLMAAPVPAGLDAVSNSASIADDEANGVDPTPGNNTDSDTTPVDAAPDLSITKSDGGVSAVPGGTVAYTLSYANNGDQGASGVQLSETVPADAAFDSAASTVGWVCLPDNSAGSACTLNLGTLSGSGGAGSAVFAVSVDNPIPAGVTEISNTASIADDSANGADPNPADNSASETTPVTATPDLAVIKSDGGITVTPGGTVAYTLDYANNGNQGAAGVQLSETVPVSSTFEAGASTAGWTCVPDINPGSVCTLDVGTLNGGGDSGSAVFGVTAVFPAPAGLTEISNTASIADDGANGADPNPGDNTASDTTPLDAAPDLSIFKTDGDISTVPGGVVIYTLDYFNFGDQGAANVQLTDTVPANSVFNPGASEPGWVCLPDNNAGSVCTLNAGAMGGGETNGSALFAVTVVNPLPAGVTQITNTATISDDGANGADPSPEDNTSTDDTPVDAVPDLAVQKDDFGARGLPGGTVVYTLTVTNNGNQGATNVLLSEIVPENSSFDPAASTPGWVCAPDNNAGSVCTLNVGTLDGSGANGSAAFAVIVDNPFPLSRETITNTVTTGDDGANGIEPDLQDNTGSDFTWIDNLPDLVLIKSDGDASVTPGGTVAYTLSYTNVGGLNSTGTALTETVPANTTFNAAASTAGWSCADGAPAPTVCTFNVGVLVGIGGNGSTVFAVTVIGAPIPAGLDQVSNTASIGNDGSNGADPNPGNNTASDTTPVNAAPDLALAKSDGGATTVPGGAVAYTLNYANNGNQGASGIQLSETVPANATFNAAASTAGWSCADGSPAGTPCTLTIGALNGGGASGTVSFALTVINPIPAGVTQIANTASIADDGANGADANPADNSAADTTPVDAAPDLAITKSDGDIEAAPGGTAAYTLNYANNGNQGATGVQLSETVPANSAFNPGASTAGWVCAPDNNAGSVCTLSVGALNGGGANGSATFAVTVINPVPAGVTQIANTASIADDGTNGADANPADNSSSDTTPLTAAPDLNIAKSDGGATTVPGGAAAYTLNYANNGNQGATGVQLSETVPANSAFNPGASTAGWVCAPDNNAGSVCMLSVGALNGGGGSGSVTFAVTVDNPVPVGVTQISNTASIADDGANGADANPADNSASDTTPVDAAPDLAITKSDGGATTVPGGAAAYTLNYANSGNQGATGVQLSETVPANATFNAAASTAGWSCADGSPAGTPCTLTIGALTGGGANGSATFAVTVINPVPAGVTQIANTASIADDGANDADANPADNSAADTTPVDAAPDLAITKSDGGIEAAPGGTAAYTLNYANNGNQGATGVQLFDTVPPNATFNTAASTAGWSCADGSPAGTPCTFDVPTLNGAGGSGSATFAVTVADPFPLGVDRITNTATIADDGANGADTNPADNSASDTTPVDAAPAITVFTASTPITEGSAATASLAFDDIGVQETHFVTITWGDGQSEAFNLPIGQLTLTATHTYVDDNHTGTPSDVVLINVTVTEPDADSDSAAASVTVDNADPALSSLSVTPVSENGLAALSGNIADLGLLDALTLLVDWGDGSAPESFNYPAGTAVFSETHQYIDDNPTGTPADSYTVTLTLSDDDTGSDSTTALAVVNNVNPALSNLSATPVNENSVATLSGNIADIGALDNFTLLVDWGDGSAPESFNYPAGTAVFSETHPYLDDNPTGTPADIYTVTLTLSDDDTGSDSATAQAVVNNVNPALSNLSVTPVNENGAATLSGNIADIGALDTFTLLVDWGDGSAPESFNYPAGTAVFSETHPYLDDNPTGTPADIYTVTLTLSDDDTGSDTQTAAAAVSNLPPSADAGADQSAAEGNTLSFNGSFSDTGTLDTHAYLWDFGDGATASGTLTPTHVYADNGVYTVTLTVTDDDSGVGVDTLVVTIANAVPSVNAGADQSVFEGDVVAFSGVFADPGSGDTHALLWEFGDGASITGTLTPTHVYADNGVYTVTLTVSDDDGAAASDSLQVSVANVAPAVNAGPDHTLPVATPLSFAGAFSDPGSADTHDIQWDFGDGVQATGALTPTHTYASFGVYTVTLTVSDDDGGVGVDTALVTVTEVSDLALTKSVNVQTALITNPLVYALTVMNLGPSAASGVTISDTLPVGAPFAAASPGCAESFGLVTCAIGSLPASASVTVYITATTQAVGVLSNNAEVSANQFDPQIANNFAAAATTVVDEIVVYTQTFTGTLGSEWCSSMITSTTPIGGREFGGEFNNETVCLQLDDLPNHSTVTVEFDLFLIRSWDGNEETWPAWVDQIFDLLAGSIGPDEWALNADGQPLLHTTFANWDEFTQAYPEGFPGGLHPAMTGAAEVRTLGYFFHEIAHDSVYHLSFTFAHGDASLLMEFMASGLQAIDDESWGLDNILVRVSTGPQHTWHRIFLPVIGR